MCLPSQSRFLPSLILYLPPTSTNVLKILQGTNLGKTDFPPDTFTLASLSLVNGIECSVMKVNIQQKQVIVLILTVTGMLS